MDNTVKVNKQCSQEGTKFFQAKVRRALEKKQLLNTYQTDNVSGEKHHLQ